MQFYPYRLEVCVLSYLVGGCLVIEPFVHLSYYFYFQLMVSVFFPVFCVFFCPCCCHYGSFHYMFFEVGWVWLQDFVIFTFILEYNDIQSGPITVAGHSLDISRLAFVLYCAVSTVDLIALHPLLVLESRLLLVSVNYRIPIRYNIYYDHCLDMLYRHTYTLK